MKKVVIQPNDSLSEIAKSIRDIAADAAAGLLLTADHAAKTLRNATENAKGVIDQAAKVASTSLHADTQAFQLIMARFDSSDLQNKAIADAVAVHVKTDEKVHAVVSVHATYWKLVIGVIGFAFVALLGWLSSKLH